MTTPPTPGKAGKDKNVIYASNAALLVGVVLLLTGVFGGIPVLVGIGALLEIVAIVFARINRQQRKSRGH